MALLIAERVTETELAIVELGVLWIRGGPAAKGSLRKAISTSEMRRRLRKTKKVSAGARVRKGL